MNKFKPEDFSGGGQYLIYDRDYDPERKSYIATIVKKVGWKMLPEKRITLVSMSDGWTQEGYIGTDGDSKRYVPWADKVAFCEYLNTRKGSQAYRFANEEEVVIATTHHKHRIKG